MDDAIIAARARHLFHLDHETGVLTWQAPAGYRKRLVGTRAGGMHPAGYRQIKFDRHVYLEHRVVWLIVHGHWPKMDLDHIDGDRANNRPANLREVTVSQNAQNRRRPHRANPYIGTSLCEGGNSWEARIKLNGKSTYLGRFPTAEAAHAAYVAAKRELHEFGML